jgi:hypothetical protein
MSAPQQAEKQAQTAARGAVIPEHKKPPKPVIQIKQRTGWTTHKSRNG